ncbi:sigma-54-dependent transcriptional regulator [Geotalea uraniireducens]|uniref:Two component, sigma-54 specific, transcriptional regulator, Fis family n=1 Tax=Geotalea uraniireducens (strain Rf4) TaxID=351605 RepID=A5G7F8_GEOUR|nr:sigma-54 dependent transcriptional regulator [Geotalea uraniireducens]ABQ27726.1 two component, sigma-54 specific, transcriptional regulator, Fis family [Geotalea uraniireducens Rf4]
MSTVVTRKEAKILVIEDDKPLRELLHMELTRSGYKVESASDGEEGLDKYRQEVFNVVLLDMRMPGMDGVEVLRQMRTESTIPEVIVFTGHGTIETAVECIKYGAYDYLTKPVKLDELEMVIDKANEKNRLRLENINLKLEISKLDQHRIVGKSQVIQKVLETVRRWGATDEHVLICGESGAGKELFARAVHDASRRANKPFVTVNCGRLSANTAESELFGHVQGAFTGANKGRAGLFELADTGTLFMDEISEMPLDVQVKLLRILETGTFRRMGGNHDISVDVRFVFASNKKLEDCVNRGEFREDLFHRINLLPINIPPLRERPEDIIPLSYYFLKSANESGSANWEISEEAMAALCAYSWPGNVRELRNTIRRASILATDQIISSDLLPFSPPKTAPSFAVTGLPDVLPLPLWVVERDYIQKVLEKLEGNKSKAAKVLEIDRKTLYTKLERYGLAV